jgi:hypothetical protein
MAVFENNLGQTKYLTGNKIVELLQSLARSTHPDMTLDEVSRFLSHSGRVWVVVLLDEAGLYQVLTSLVRRLLPHILT